MNHISQTDLRSNLADILNRAHYQRQRIVVERRNEPIAALVPIEDLELLERLEEAEEARWAENAAQRAMAEGGAPRPAEDVFHDLESH
jgi:prevent-host-death family protein